MTIHYMITHEPTCTNTPTGCPWASPYKPTSDERRLVYTFDEVGPTHQGISRFIGSFLTENMKRDSKNASCSSKPGGYRGKFTSRFCMFPKVKSADSSPGFVPVYLNVYDLTPANGYMYWAGLGIYHTGVEIYGAEYAFGAHDFPTSGVFEVEPRQCPGFKFRKAIFMGTTSLEPSEVREFMEQQSRNYYGDTYHLIVKNCNHFCDDISYKLTGKRIPKWVNRLARIGSHCNCILPESLKASTIPDPHIEVYESEKKHLRPFSCFSSFSMSQKEESVSSFFLHSHYSGCLPPWDSKRTRSGFFEEDD